MTPRAVSALASQGQALTGTSVAAPCPTRLILRQTVGIGLVLVQTLLIFRCSLAAFA